MQVSSKKLSSEQTSAISDQLYALLAQLQKPEDVKLFLRDFLTDTERTVLIKRLAIALMLHEAKSYTEIRKALNVSSATISSVSEVSHTDGLKLAIKMIHVSQWADDVLSKWFK